MHNHFKGLREIPQILAFWQTLTSAQPIRYLVVKGQGHCGKKKDVFNHEATIQMLIMTIFYITVR